jgi:tripartite-type tricarboxylate transporter receptor subunit TctC
MKFPRRSFLHLAAGAAVLPALPRIARAETYPARPVRFIVGFPASNASDIAARLMAQKLSEQLGQSFITENRPGASGNIATEFVVRAPPDGYTLLLISPSAITNSALYSNLNFDFIRDIAPVAGFARAPFLLAVNPSVPAKTVPEFIAYAKANPDKINVASAGTGSFSHMCGALFNAMTGIKVVHVPYKASFLPDLLGGQVQCAFSPISQSIDFIRAGKLNALGVTTASRQDALPNVPAIAESVPGYEASTWYGIGAPRGTPAEISDSISKALSTSLADPKLKAQLAELGAVPMSMSPAEFGKLLAAETEKWGNVVREANIKPE